MDNYNTYVGMDVHARSVMCTSLNSRTGETFTKRISSAEGDDAVAEWVGKLEKPVLAAYESGCTGYHLAERLNAIKDVKCEIVAISSLARSPKESASKCDKVDARALLCEITNKMPRWKSVYIPSKNMQAKKELARTLEINKQLLRESKQRVNAFLIRQGYIWNEQTESGNLRKRWSRNYYNWLNSIKFDQPEMQEALNILIDEVVYREECANKIKAKIKNHLAEQKEQTMIDSLRCLKGIDINTANLIYCTFGEFNRFTNGRKIPSYFGCIPRDASSGEKTNNKGHATKSGDKYVRHAIIEALASIPRWNKTKAIPKEALVSDEVKRLARVANDRVIEKYRRLVGNGKHVNVAKVACASEILKFAWAIGCQVEREFDM